MRVALFIIVIFLGAIVNELNIMPSFICSALSAIAAWRLLDDYYEFKNRTRGKKG